LRAGVRQHQAQADYQSSLPLCASHGIPSDVRIPQVFFW